ncbi:TRAP transporter substrate-binding protein [Neptunomonas japonica]|uniref:TRAP dicarboxylate transporter DctP subunit n=1 Tax=Neptunomonas japonica JAMM 1380 TaxID=1441457 RepID=A0A7R6PSP4_9GAMM|nr:TRAP transporter substrate-binding protein [Neptunomonas japonica]BBB29690.1 TRAP dicarboxylate transporter DctP subunit [Neptunomonas japonica JAMM 1380]
MKKIIKSKALLSFAMLAATSIGGQASAANKVLLKMPTAYGTHLPVLGETQTWLVDQVATISSKRVKIKLYEPGKLVAPFEILDVVSKGKANAGFGSPGYWAGKMPASPLFNSVPFGPDAGEYLAWIYFGNGGKLWQQMYDDAGYNVKPMLCGMLPPETSGWFSKEINSPDDLKGLKMRFAGLGGKVMQKLGVSVTLLPGGEIFPSLEKGAIDATEFSMPSIDSKLGFHKLVKYNYFPGWHQQASTMELLINKDTWNSMDETQQAALEVSCRAAVTYSLAIGEASQFKTMNDNVENKGVTNVRWSDEMLETFKNTWDEVAEEQSSNDPFFKVVLDDLNSFRDQYSIWGKNAFLPK